MKSRFFIIYLDILFLKSDRYLTDIRLMTVSVPATTLTK